MISDYYTHNHGQDRIRTLEEQVALLQDVEAHLLRSQRNLKDAERLAKLGHWELDIVNNELSWSDEIFRIFEIDPAKFQATYEAFLDAIHPEDREMVNNAYSRSLKSRTPYSVHHRLKMSDGRIKYVSEHCVTDYDEHGDPIRSMGTVHDLTDRVEREEEKVRVQKFEALGTLAGGIAHDFNNLLVAVLGNLELAEEKIRDEKELHVLIDDARKGALRARDISRQLLTFSKGGEPVRESADLGELVRDAASFYRSGTSVHIEYLMADELWNAEVDPGQISQVLQNLILNATQAMPEGGSISIKCSNREIAVQDDVPVPSGRYLEIEIRDAGPGMDELVVKQAFDPYFSTKDKGSGLGLSIVRSIVQRHGGHISLRSRLGEGSVFTIFLPAGESAPVPECEARVPATGALRILVVDDEELVCQLTDRMARRLGHQADCVRTSEEAIKAFNRNLENGELYDLVILDLTMPGDKGGLWILKELKRLDPTVRAVVSSGYFEDGVLADHLRDGFAGILKKPFTIKEMERALVQSRV